MPTQNITLDGEVQDVGLRELIAELGEKRGERGVVFNEVDGTVRVVTSGTRRRAAEFVAEIKSRSDALHADIESVEMVEVDGEIDLPPFGILPTDDLADIGRKLGTGIRGLTNLERSLSRVEQRLSSLPEIEGSLANVDGSVSNVEGSLSRVERSLSNVETNTETLVDGQDRLVDGQERMIEILDERLVDGQERMIDLLDERL